MDPRPKAEPSPGASTDPNPAVPPAPSGAGRPRVGERPTLSWGAFRHLITDAGAGAELTAARVTAVLGSSVAGPGGTSWISATSSHGYGRLTRHPDGSSELHAHRSADGAVLVDVARTDVRREDLDELIDAIDAGTPAVHAHR